MPMIDVYTPDGVDREIAQSLRRSASRRGSTRQLRSVSSYNILNSAVFDIDQTAAAATRNRLLLMLSRGDVLIAGPHMPFPGLGRLYKDRNRYRWSPVVFTDQWVER